jgi:signal transduction histidine kinase
MQGFAKILHDEHSQRLDDTARDYLQRIIVSSHRLDALIQDVLDYSKIVRSDLPVQTVQTGEFIHQIIDSYPNLEAHKAEIHMQEPLPPVLANQAALTQVISNLLGNAVKFTRPGIEPDIHVRAEVLSEPQPPSERSPPAADDRDGERHSKNRSSVVRLWFEDNGIGIRRDLHERIFRMFERINAPGEFAGTGMGLTIVRKAVERMGGAAGVESEPGKGSRFWIELQKAE